MVMQMSKASCWGQLENCTSITFIMLQTLGAISYFFSEIPWGKKRQRSKNSISVMSRTYKHSLVTLYLRGVQNCWQYLWFFSWMHSVRGSVFLINSQISTFFRWLNLHRIAWRNKNDWWKNISACLCMGFTAAGRVREGKRWINIIAWCRWSFCWGDKLLLF